MGHIYLNTNTGQDLSVYNAHLALRKVCKQYEYKISPIRLTILVRLGKPNQNILEVAVIINQVISNVLSSMQFYLTGEGVRGIALGETGLNQCHHHWNPPTKIPLSCSYGLMSSHPYWPILF